MDSVQGCPTGRGRNTETVFPPFLASHPDVTGVDFLELLQLKNGEMRERLLNKVLQKRHFLWLMWSHRVTWIMAQCCGTALVGNVSNTAVLKSWWRGGEHTSGLSVCLWPGMYGMGVFEQDASFQASVWLYLRFKGFQFPARRFRCFPPVFQEGIQTHSTSDEINSGPKCLVKESSLRWERQGSWWGVRSLLATLLLLLICNAMLHFPCRGGNAATSGTDVILIAFVCCTALWTLETHSQPSDPAFSWLYTLTYSSALRHIDLIPSVF